MDLARQRSRCYQPYEFQAQMQGYCTLQLWKTTSLGGGSAEFVDWCIPFLQLILAYHHHGLVFLLFASCPKRDLSFDV